MDSFFATKRYMVILLTSSAYFAVVHSKDDISTHIHRGFNDTLFRAFFLLRASACTQLAEQGRDKILVRDGFLNFSM